VPEGLPAPSPAPKASGKARWRQRHALAPPIARLAYDQNHLVAALDSPDQGVSGLPAIKVSQKEAAFHFEVPIVSGVYAGTLNAAKREIAGTWTQTHIEQSCFSAAPTSSWNWSVRKIQ